MNLRAVSATNVGWGRGNNEDAHVVQPRGGPDEVVYVFAVADGMGGHPAGERASRVAIDLVLPTIGYYPFLANVREALDGGDGQHGLFGEAHRKLLEEGARYAERCGMGTTLTVCAVEDRELHVGHVGDSSAFLIRGERIKPLTVPAVGEFGGLGAGLGVTPLFFQKMDYARESLQPADVVILCTDGLTRYFDAPQICRVVRKTPFDEVADKLVQKALDAGGEDNVTVIAALVG